MQHADRHVDIQTYYLPLMQKAVNEGKMNKKNFAYFIDRIAVNMGFKQIFGTQFRPPNIIPIYDLNNVELFRSIMGLEPLEEYIQRTNINIDIDSITSEITFDYSTKPINALPQLHNANISKEKFYEFVLNDLQSRSLEIQSSQNLKPKKLNGKNHLAFLF